MVRLQEYDFTVFEENSEACKDCVNFKEFKEKCWYYWEKKKECSQKLK